MVRIRLKRMGRKKAPFYRIVVANSKVQRDGKVIEEIGYYHPMLTEKEKNLNEYEMDREKYLAWIQKGAKPSDSVKHIAKKLGIE